MALTIIVYEWFNKRVVWIEANPLIFNDLVDNISNLYGQIAFNGLLGEENKSNVQFYLSNNDYASSSIFQFSDNLKEELTSNKKINDGKKNLPKYDYIR